MGELFQRGKGQRSGWPFLLQKERFEASWEWTGPVIWPGSLDRFCCEAVKRSECCGGSWRAENSLENPLLGGVAGDSPPGWVSDGHDPRRA
ncbi:MAG: hypothetical protein L0387_40400 [Acidobacteria bacterium]|nr:hypothetical protein [Acidobacteriota bacterium]